MGKKHGQGTFSFANGNSYSGLFKDGNYIQSLKPISRHDTMKSSTEKKKKKKTVKKSYTQSTYDEDGYSNTDFE